MTAVYTTPMLLPDPPQSRFWREIRDADPDAYTLFVRHYSYRRSAKRKWAGRKFIGPGEYMLLTTPDRLAIFAWRKFIPMDGQSGVNCSIFRNEGPELSSELILDAESWATQKWGPQRLYTYVDPRKVRSPNPGWCFVCAGWSPCGRTKSGLRILEKLP